MWVGFVWIAVIIAGVRYHIWTEGCQMNVADSNRVAAALEDLNYTPTKLPNQADVIVSSDNFIGRLYLIPSILVLYIISTRALFPPGAQRQDQRG